MAAAVTVTMIPGIVPQVPFLMKTTSEMPVMDVRMILTRLNRDHAVATILIPIQTMTELRTVTMDAPMIPTRRPRAIAVAAYPKPIVTVMEYLTARNRGPMEMILITMVMETVLLTISRPM